VQEYFLQIRPIDECTAADGTLLGHMLMDAARKAKRNRRAKAIATFVSRTAMLREAPLAHLGIVLQSIICKESRASMISVAPLAGDVGTQDPALLSAADAGKIADGISSIRRSHTVLAKVVAEVFTQYVVLRATAQQCAWFQTMLVALLERQMNVLMVETVDSNARRRRWQALVAGCQGLARRLRCCCVPANQDEESAQAPVVAVAAKGPAVAASAPTSDFSAGRPNYAALKLPVSAPLQLPAR
jgi:hypothetical protein